MQKVIGLIGYPLTHSFSNRYFTDKFKNEGLVDFRHEIFPLEHISNFSNLVQRREDIIGLNVTIPYKESILPLLDELDSSAAAVGAVNTIKILRTQSDNKPKLIGFNTDVFGFGNALKPFLKNNHQRALILGTGGSAKAVAFVLKQLGIDYFFVSRNKLEAKLDVTSTVFNYTELNENHFNSCHLLVNCSPVGMAPNAQDFPDLPYSFIGPQHLLFDLIYNPEETLFLRKGKEQRALTQNGLTMLYLQAEASWKIWNS